MVEAYSSAKCIESLMELIETDLKPLRDSLDLLWKFHRNNWLSFFKPFGLEIIELRYAAIRSRLSTMQDRITEYCEKTLKGEKAVIDEFEASFNLPAYEG